MDSTLARNVTIVNVFTAKKVSCLRWRPVPQQSLSTKSTQFLCGTYGYEDSVQLWEWLDESEDPQLIGELPWTSDVTCIQYISNDAAAVASGAGHVTLTRHTQTSVENSLVWDGLHRCRSGPLSCTWIAVLGTSFASVGEDGRINLLEANSQTPLRVIDEADSCSINRALYVTHNELLTANMRGQLKLFDTRSSDDSSALSTSSLQQTSMTALCGHPTQRHVVVSGDADGAVCVWDIRQPRHPVADLGSHESEVSELMFHRYNPNHLFSASQDGCVWHWNANTSASILELSTTALSAKVDVDQKSAWLALDSSKRHMEVISLLPDSHLPVNSLDVAEDWILCGGDGAAVHVLSAAV